MDELVRRHAGACSHACHFVDTIIPFPAADISAFVKSSRPRIDLLGGELHSEFNAQEYVLVSNDRYLPAIINFSTFIGGQVCLFSTNNSTIDWVLIYLVHGVRARRFLVSTRWAEFPFGNYHDNRWKAVRSLQSLGQASTNWKRK